MSSCCTDSGNAVGERCVNEARAVGRWQGLKVARQARGSARGGAGRRALWKESPNLNNDIPPRTQHVFQHLRQALLSGLSTAFDRH